MGKGPKFRIRFFADPAASGMLPQTWDANHDGPLDDAKRAACGTLKDGTYPMANRFTIYDYSTDAVIFSSTKPDT